MYFSIIIPVFNRPGEVQELLDSLALQEYGAPFEIIIVEDGSTIDCKTVVNNFKQILDITYIYKENSGPGDSRNYGMHRAKGDYYIIFDSDCVIPKTYLTDVAKNLSKNYYECFGGPDDAQKSFSNIQKAINYSMTSIFTTGGVRGGVANLSAFEPRSFNMGLSKKAFQLSGGFGNIHPGEDPDLTMRLWKLGFKTTLFSNAFVYHKRRIDWKKFFVQVNKFGKARPILNLWHPTYKKITYFFPTLFVLGFYFSVLICFFITPIFLSLYFVYFTIIFLHATYLNKSGIVGILSIQATAIQFFGYGTGFLKSYVQTNVLKRKPENVFPELFYKKK